MQNRPAPRPVVLLHGLLSTPREFGLIALPLRAAGVTLITPAIEGYTEADRRQPRRWTAWVDAAARAIDRAVPKDQPFVLGGLCSGGLIAAALALDERLPVETLVLMSPTFAFDGWGQSGIRHWRRLVYALRLARWFSVAERSPYGIKNEKLRLWVERDMRERAGSAAGPSHLPLWAIGETERLRDHVVRRLPALPMRSVVLHARDDEVCSLAAVERVCRTLPRHSNSLVVLEDSYHMITLDNDRRRVADELVLAANAGDDASADPRDRQPIAHAASRVPAGGAVAA
ncbi:MAG: alpha/beta hydrolase [Caldimonas sp.]